MFILNFEAITLQESRRVFDSTITLSNEGAGGISEAMTSGFVVSSRGTILVGTFLSDGLISQIVYKGLPLRGIIIDSLNYVL
jgi:hypothetical protein